MRKKRLSTSTILEIANRAEIVATREVSLEIVKKRALKALENHDFDNDMGSGNLFILDSVLAPISFFKDRFSHKFEVDDILAVWQLFLELCREINNYKSFAPTITTFCNFMNMGKATFDTITNENTERGELCRYIKSALTDRFTQLMLDDKLPQIPSIFIAKADFGLRDNDPPVTNIVFTEECKTPEQILEEFRNG